MNPPRPGWPSTSGARTSRPRTLRARPVPCRSNSGSGPTSCPAALGLAGRRPCRRADRVALTMTAELCDCYPTKAVGVRSVLDAVSTALPATADGRLGDRRPVPRGRGDPRAARCSRRRRTGWRWRRSPRRLIPEGPGLLIDIGSTTADLIPMVDGRVAVRGRTDTERLQTGELVYAGVRRTPLCSLAAELPFRGRADRPDGRAVRDDARRLPDPRRDPLRPRRTSPPPTADRRPPTPPSTASPGWSAPTATGSPPTTPSPSPRPPTTS